MIKEDYCSYEVAKLLKEKGFDELTTFVWYQHLPASLDCRNLVNKKARDYFYYNETTEHNSSYNNSQNKPEYIHGDIFSCPTHQMAMKWLREKGIDISITPEFSTEEEPCVDFLCGYSATIFKTQNGEYIDEYIINKEEEWGSAPFDTYEEAVETALKYTLENLIEL